MDIYDRIDNILQERNMSRRQLAYVAKIPPTTLQSALSRKKNITVDMLEKIADALGADINYLRNGYTLQERDAKMMERAKVSSLKGATQKALNAFGYKFDVSEDGQTLTITEPSGKRHIFDGKDENEYYYSISDKLEAYTRFVHGEAVDHVIKTRDGDPDE